MVEGTPIYNYSWESLKQDSKNLAGKVWIWKFKFILAVTKWGLIPAYFVASHLGIKVIKTVCLSSYKNKNIQWPMIHHTIDSFTEEIKNQKDWLVVDDLSDTGYTIEYIRQKYPAIKIAVLLQKKTGGHKADFYGREVENIWVKFPYEMPLKITNE